MTIEETQFYPRKINDNIKINDFYDCFMSSIENRASKNGNFLSLSSGWDSTSILAALIKIKGKKKINVLLEE